MIKTLLENAGFTDIVENANGTCNAVKDGVKYSGLYMAARNPGMIDSGAVITEEVPLELVNKEDEQ